MMKELLKKLQKKSNKKGFTLVEIIVVLVILAILAAIAVPSVLGYVNEAKEERYIQEAHSIYVVIQTEKAKSEALGETTPTYGKGTAAADAKDYTGTGICKKAFDMTKLQVEKIAPTTKNNKQVYKLKWKSDDGKTIKADLTKNNDVKITSKS
ncbi:type II secretion system protein [Faecalibacillus intestinalis]|uniref:type II secretion system protein n=1 Tax=Faecalibacillus intestinalis TaxID=1982626 RepID=UPI003522DB72